MSTEYASMKIKLQNFKRQLDGLGSKPLSSRERRRFRARYEGIVHEIDSTTLPNDEKEKLREYLKEFQGRFRHLGFMEIMETPTSGSTLATTVKDKQTNFKSPSRKENDAISPQQLPKVHDTPKPITITPCMEYFIPNLSHNEHTGQQTTRHRTGKVRVDSYGHWSQSSVKNEMPSFDLNTRDISNENKKRNMDGQGSRNKDKCLPELTVAHSSDERYDHSRYQKKKETYTPSKPVNEESFQVVQQTSLSIFKTSNDEWRNMDGRGSRNKVKYLPELTVVPSSDERHDHSQKLKKKETCTPSKPANEESSQGVQQTSLSIFKTSNDECQADGHVSYAKYDDRTPYQSPSSSTWNNLYQHQGSFSAPLLAESSIEKPPTNLESIVKDQQFLHPPVYNARSSPLNYTDRQTKLSITNSLNKECDADGNVSNAKRKYDKMPYQSATSSFSNYQNWRQGSRSVPLQAGSPNEKPSTNLGRIGQDQQLLHASGFSASSSPLNYTDRQTKLSITNSLNKECDADGNVSNAKGKYDKMPYQSATSSFSNYQNWRQGSRSVPLQAGSPNEKPSTNLGRIGQDQQLLHASGFSARSTSQSSNYDAKHYAQKEKRSKFNEPKIPIRKENRPYIGEPLRPGYGTFGNDSIRDNTSKEKKWYYQVEHLKTDFKKSGSGSTETDTRSRDEIGYDRNVESSLANRLINQRASETLYKEGPEDYCGSNPNDQVEKMDWQSIENDQKHLQTPVRRGSEHFDHSALCGKFRSDPIEANTRPREKEMYQNKVGTLKPIYEESRTDSSEAKTPPRKKEMYHLNIDSALANRLIRLLGSETLDKGCQTDDCVSNAEEEYDQKISHTILPESLIKKECTNVERIEAGRQCQQVPACRVRPGNEQFDYPTRDETSNSMKEDTPITEKEGSYNIEGSKMKKNHEESPPANRPNQRNSETLSKENQTDGYVSKARGQRDYQCAVVKDEFLPQAESSEPLQAEWPVSLEPEVKPLKTYNVQYFRDDLDLNSLNNLDYIERIDKIHSYAKSCEARISHFSEEKYSMEYYVLNKRLVFLIETLYKIDCQDDKQLTARKIKVMQYIKVLQNRLSI